MSRLQKTMMLPKVPFMRCIREKWSRLGSWTSGLSPPAEERSSWKEGFKLLCLNFSLPVKNLHGDLTTTLIPVFHPYTRLGFNSFIPTLSQGHAGSHAEGGQRKADPDI